MNDPDLSALLAGELDPYEAAAVYARIATDPILAAEWRVMRALPDHLAALRDESPPLGLDEHVFASLPPPAPDRASRWPWWIAAAGTVAAAASVLWVAWPASPRVLHLARGQQHVVGEAELRAGDVRVDIDGEAWVTVEPHDHPVRRAEQEDPMNVTQLVAGAAGGALVTVAVVQGSAWLWPADGAPIEVRTGEARTVGVPRTPAAGEVTPTPRPKPGPELAAAPPAVASYVRQLEARLDELELENRLIAGQLAAVEGRPVAWPTGTDAASQEAEVRRLVTEAVAGSDLLTLEDVICDEYPCIAALRGSWEGEGDPLRPEVDKLQDALKQAWGVDDLGMMLSMRMGQDGDRTNALVLAVPYPKGEGVDDAELEHRLPRRLQELDAELADLMTPPKGG